MDPDRTYPIRAPQTRHSSHRGNFTNPCSTFPVHDHSFIHYHACFHTFIHTFIHTFHPIHPSIAYAIIVSQLFASCHEAEVVSFDMSGDRPGFEGRPVKGSRPPRVKQSQGEITETSPSGPAQPRSEADWDISNLFSFDSNPEPNPQNLHRGEASGPSEPIERLGHLLGGGLRSCGVPPEGSADPVSK